ncbi:MAG TPA: S41 family peptidase [Dokdonella sp.]|uniref:S41 family peptidase n=1 Tax=Dokdonella sp. TaxID=2291710 RepID=UPI002D7E2D79|nr:S41 family peptidase [Dokdonella sp.]HET9031320.1 S41 family peptidase [Dokdonella sp.]
MRFSLMAPRFRFRLILAAALALSSHAWSADPPVESVPTGSTDSAVDVDEAVPPQAAVGAKKSSLGEVNLDDVRRFTAVMSLVKQAYVEPVDDHQLMLAAIKGMLVGLDPHSEYLEAGELDQLNEDTSGSYAGLGIEISTADGFLRVIAPIDDTPAERAGIKPGDTILRIDNEPVQADNLNDAVDMLRGKPGSEVVLSILREGSRTPQDFKLVRELIHVASVRGRLLEPGYAYLRISQFQAETGSDLRKRIARLQKENGKPLRGAVLDLRSNPGGLLNAAVEVSDLMLDSGGIVTTRGRIHESDMAFSATPGDALNGASIVVLIDRGTASAAEIVAGALKDNHRALLMGRRSFGKGSVQTVLTLDDRHALKLTTARYYTPSGVSIQAEGIQPDIELADLALSKNEDNAYGRISERDLRNHLRGDTESADEDAGAQAPASHSAPSDYALNEAIHALKAMALQQQRSTPGVPASKAEKG